MSYILFLDDIRDPARDCACIVARSSKEALELVISKGMPSFMSVDHDLGGDDTTMTFLKALYTLHPNGPVPAYKIHSANIVGSRNIESFLESWKYSLTLP